MALFQTMQAAEARALAKGPSGDNTWIEAHACRDDRGRPAVRVYRKISAVGGPGWAILTDDSQV